MDNNIRIKKYVNAIKQIDEGQRNDSLYKLGLSLRQHFELTGDTLESALSEINQTKCNPSLPENDVTTIARSVNKSDMSAGENAVANNGRHGKQTTKAERKQYVVRISADTVSVDTLLSKEVSMYPNCWETTSNETSSIDKVLETFRTDGKSKALIEAIRKETDKDKRNKLKKKLPAVVFGSEPQTERNNGACTPNEIICLDFDNIPKDELESAKAKIAAVPYVFAVGLSVSGTGLFALAAYTAKPKLADLIAGMQADFPCTIDKSRSDLCGLRYVTLDENLLVKDIVYPAVLTKQIEKNSRVIIPRLTDVSKIEIKPIEWLWGNKFPYGGLSILAGLPKQGKSMLTAYMAAVITQGRNWCDGMPCEQGSVLFFAGEDNPEEYARRLKANGADLTKIRILDGATLFCENTNEHEEVGITLARLDVLEAAIDMTEKATGIPVRMVVIDPTAVSFLIVPPDGRIDVVDTGIEKTGNDFEAAWQQAKGNQGRPPTELYAAVAWLQNVLADGAKPAREIYEMGKAYRFTESTLWRAGEVLHIKQKGGHKNNPSTWSLPSVSDGQTAD